MDEDDLDIEQEIKPMRHDRWSVLILGLSWITQVSSVTTDTLELGLNVACQHANQMKFDRKFKEMIDRGL